jgi:hypothetical protein
MDDFCKKQNVFLSGDDRTKFTVDKSKSHFKLFRNTMNTVFQNVPHVAEVPGLDVLINETSKRKSQ